MEAFRRNTERILGLAGQRNRGILIVLLTSVLMMGLTLPLVWAYAHMNNNLAGAPADLWLILLLCVGMAGGGAIGVRAAGMSWWQIILAAVFAGAGITILSSFDKLSPLYPEFGDDVNFDITIKLTWFLAGIVSISSPVFLLALFDPEIRKTTPSFTIWKVVVGALLIMIPFLWFDLEGISYSGTDAGQVGLGIIIFVSYLLLFIALIIVLRLPMDARGPRLGSLGILLQLFTLIIWTLLRYVGIL